MSEVGRGAEHHRAGTGDHADLVLAAVLDGGWRNTRTLLSDGLMHPHTADAGVAAVLYDPLGDLRPRDDHDAVDPTRDRSQIRVTPIDRRRTSAGADSPRRPRARSSSSGDRSDCRPGGGCCRATRRPPRYASAPGTRPLSFRG